MSKLESEERKLSLKFTRSGVEKLNKTIAEQDPEKEYYLRVYLKSTESGLKYGMALDTNKNQDDIDATVSGLNVVVDTTSYQYVNGSTIDYEEGEESVFKITNKNVELNKLTGCGSSSCRGGACGGGKCKGGCCGTSTDSCC